MACGACAQQRQMVLERLRRGDVAGTFRAVSLGMKMAAEKAAGVDIEKKYLGEKKGGKR